MSRKTLQKLTIKDNFMFAAVMMDSDNCKHLLEMVLDTDLREVHVIAEKSIVYHPEHHGIRLDVIANDEEGSHYSIEMQVQKRETVKRSRYYHAQMDTELLLAGRNYEELPDVYVIFICDYDPFGDGKYMYTVTSLLKESMRSYEDGSHSIFLSTAGKNKNEVAPELVKFLEFVHADLDECMKDYEDDFIDRLQASIQKIKADRELEGRYMVLEEMLRNERNEGREEGRKEGHAEGNLDGMRKVLLLFAEMKYKKIPEILKEQILSQNDEARLLQWNMNVQSADTVEEFIEMM